MNAAACGKHGGFSGCSPLTGCILHFLQVVWLQSGISDRQFEEEIAKAGITVVADRCLMVDHDRATARL